MKMISRLGRLLLLLSGVTGYAQTEKEVSSPSNPRWFSLGVRSTVSLFDHDGAGLGTGGQFRVQLNERVNTDWYADYISIEVKEGVRSTYYHIGWSVLYYPFAEGQGLKKVQPYILAGHCFDYNEKTVIAQPSISESRWGSAVQAGIGSHFHISPRFDLSLTAQYMTHLTEELQVSKGTDGEPQISRHAHSSLEGHLLTTVSLNYKLFKLWKK